MKTWTEHTNDERYKNLGWEDKLEFADFYANRLKQSYPDRKDDIDTQLKIILEDIDKSYADFRKSPEATVDRQADIELGVEYNKIKELASKELGSGDDILKSGQAIIKTKDRLEELKLGIDDVDKNGNKIDKIKYLEALGKDADVITRDTFKDKKTDVAQDSVGFINYNKKALFSKGKGLDYVINEINNIKGLETEKRDAVMRATEEFNNEINSVNKVLEENAREGIRLPIEGNYHKFYKQSKEATHEDKKKDATLKLIQSTDGLLGSLRFARDKSIVSTGRGFTGIPAFLINTFSDEFKKENKALENPKKIIEALDDLVERDRVENIGSFVTEEGTEALVTGGVSSIGRKQGLKVLGKMFGKTTSRKSKTLGYLGAVLSEGLQEGSKAYDNLSTEQFKLKQELEKAVADVDTAFKSGRSPEMIQRLQSRVDQIDKKIQSAREVGIRSTQTGLSESLASALMPKGLDFAKKSWTTSHKFIKGKIMNALKQSLVENLEERTSNTVDTLAQHMTDVAYGRTEDKEDTLLGELIKAFATEMGIDESIAVGILGSAAGFTGVSKIQDGESATSKLNELFNTKDGVIGRNVEDVDSASIIKLGKEVGIIRDKSEITEDMVNALAKGEGIKPEQARKELEALYDLGREGYLKQFGLGGDKLQDNEPGVEEEKKKIQEEYSELDDDFGIAGKLDESETTPLEEDEQDVNSDLGKLTGLSKKEIESTPDSEQLEVTYSDEAEIPDALRELKPNITEITVDGKTTKKIKIRVPFSTLKKAEDIDTDSDLEKKNLKPTGDFTKEDGSTFTSVAKAKEGAKEAGLNLDDYDFVKDKERGGVVGRLKTPEKDDGITDNTNLETKEDSNEVAEGKPVESTKVETPRERFQREQKEAKVEQKEQELKTKADIKLKTSDEKQAEKFKEQKSKDAEKLRKDFFSEETPREKFEKKETERQRLAREKAERTKKKQENAKTKAKIKNDRKTRELKTKTKERKAKLDKSNKNIEAIQDLRGEVELAQSQKRDIKDLAKLVKKARKEVPKKVAEKREQELTESEKNDFNDIKQRISKARKEAEKREQEFTESEKNDFNDIKQRIANARKRLSKEDSKDLKEVEDNITPDNVEQAKEVVEKIEDTIENDNSNLPTEKTDQEVKTEDKQEEALQETKQDKKDFKEVKAEKSLNKNALSLLKRWVKPIKPRSTKD